MDLGKFLSLKDFFNYYVAGSIWIIDFWLILLLLPISPNLDELLKILTTGNTVIQTILTIVITILSPYSVGFVLSEVGDIITSTVHQIFGDPTKWVADYSCNCYQGRRVPQSIVNRAAYYAHQLFGVGKEKFKENPRQYFFQMRAYVANKTGGASDFATRALDLANFAESIIIPLPLLFSITSFFLSRDLLGFGTLASLLGFIVIFFATFALSVKRYLRLKENWVKHIYRGFIVLAESDMYERDKKAGNSQ